MFGNSIKALTFTKLAASSFFNHPAQDEIKECTPDATGIYGELEMENTDASYGRMYDDTFGPAHDGPDEEILDAAPDLTPRHGECSDDDTYAGCVRIDEDHWGPPSGDVFYDEFYDERG
jgi:hypothetical protein